MTIELEVLEGVSSGTTGIVKVSASSEKNAAESTSVDLIFEVRTIHDLRFTLEGEDELTTGETTSVEFILHVTNHGNIVETGDKDLSNKLENFLPSSNLIILSNSPNIKKVGHLTFLTQLIPFL